MWPADIRRKCNWTLTWRGGGTKLHSCFGEFTSLITLELKAERLNFCKHVGTYTMHQEVDHETNWTKCELWLCISTHSSIRTWRRSDCCPLLISLCSGAAAVGQEATTRDKNIRLTCFCQASVFTHNVKKKNKIEVWRSCCKDLVRQKWGFLHQYPFYRIRWLTLPFSSPLCLEDFQCWLLLRENLLNSVNLRQKNSASAAKPAFAQSWPLTASCQTTFKNFTV